MTDIPRLWGHIFLMFPIETLRLGDMLPLPFPEALLPFPFPEALPFFLFGPVLTDEGMVGFETELEIRSGAF